MAYVLNQYKDEEKTGSSGMGQPAGAMGGTEKRVGTEDSAGVSNTSPMGQGAGTAPKAPADFTKSKMAGAGTIMARNQGVAQDSAIRRVTGDAIRTLTGNKANLATKQGDYLNKGRTGIADTSKGLGDDEVMGALKSGTAPLQARLNATPVSVQDFDPGSFSPIEETEYLRSGDASNLLGREADSNYTQGMGAIDNLAFNRSGAAQQVRSQVGGLQGDFRRDLDAALGKEGAAALLKKEAEAANSKMQGDLKSQIERLATGITGSLAGRREAGAKANAEALVAQKTARENDIRKILGEYQAKLAGLRKGPYADANALGAAEQAFSGFSKGNLDRFIKTSNPTLSDDMFLADDEVTALNNAAGLLGNKNIYQKGAAGSVSAGFDPNAFRRELDALLNPNISKNAAFVEEQNRLARAKDLAKTVTSGKGVPGNEGAAGPTATGKKPTPVAAPKPGAVAKDAGKTMAEQAKANAKVAVDPRKQAAEAKKKADEAAAAAKKLKDAAAEKAKQLANAAKPSNLKEKAKKLDPTSW